MRRQQWHEVRIVGEDWPSSSSPRRRDRPAIGRAARPHDIDQHGHVLGQRIGDSPRVRSLGHVHRMALGVPRIQEGEGFGSVLLEYSESHEFDVPVRGERHSLEQVDRDEIDRGKARRLPAQ